MTTPARRDRSLTAASKTLRELELPAELRCLIEPLLKCQTAPESIAIGDLQQKSEALHRIRQFIVDSPQPFQAKDAFRHLHGFPALLNVIRSLSGFYAHQKLLDHGKQDFFGLLRATLGVLSEVLEGHWGNRRYFAKKVEQDGWEALGQALASIGIGDGRDNGLRQEEVDEQLFGCLFSFGLRDESQIELFHSVRRHATADSEVHSNLISSINSEHSRSENPHDKSTVVLDTSDPSVVLRARIKLKDALHSTELLHNAEIVPVILKLWLAMARNRPKTSYKPRLISLLAILALHQLADLSKFNLVAIHTTGVLSTALPCLTDLSLSSLERGLVQDFCGTLLTLGITTLQDAHFLFRNSSEYPLLTDVLLKAIKTSRSPRHIQFDLSLHGFASIELPTLGQTFPPGPSSAGYTFAAWVYIDEFDPNTHTTIFGAFDASQACFVLAYLEKDTRNFILQTSVTSSRPSVRFRKPDPTFKEHRWYHLALVHHRPRTTSSSKATLFIDGVAVETVKCQYPASPPLLTSGTENLVSLPSSDSKYGPVQVFLGTPQDLSARQGKNLVSTRWSLASAYLFEEALSKDLVAVYFQLGPRYHGNFQDCLGSFQTYEASAALNIINEDSNPNKYEKSDIVRAIRSKAGNLVPESRILFNVSPNAVLDDDDRNNIDESQLLKSLSKPAGRVLRNLTRSGNAVVINGAVPSINDALTQLHGVAILTGTPVVVVPQALDDASWRVGGCVPVGLKLIEAAQTKDTVINAVGILLQSIKGNWRNSEAIERENGFGILAALVRAKMGAGAAIGSSSSGFFLAIEANDREREDLSFELLKLILDFLGYDFDYPEMSVINNPLAYRTLLTEFDMWRRTAPATQKLYYKQFIDFGVRSVRAKFNIKRLLKSRITKKLLDALKGETFTTEVFPDFLNAFKSLIECDMSAETLRSLALFITYALRKSPGSSSRPLRAKQSSIHLDQEQERSSARLKGPKSRELRGGVTGSPAGLSRVHIGVEILRIYCELLCDRKGISNLNKFARTVTNKWLLYLLAEDEPRVVVLGLRILARLLTIHGSSYVKKFAEKTGGFVIMRHRLRRWWNIPTIWPLCFAIMFDHDVAQIDFGRTFDLYSLLETFSIDDKATVVYPQIVPVIISMIQNGLKTVVKDQEDPESPSNNRSKGDDMSEKLTAKRPKHIRRRSMSLNTEVSSQLNNGSLDERLREYASLLHTISHFLADIHTKSVAFRDFAVSSPYVQELLFILFPIIVSSDAVSAETELNSRGSALTFDGGDVVIRPLSRTIDPPPIVRTTSVEAPPSPTAQRARPLRRGSSFILITSERATHPSSSARLNPIMSPKTKDTVALNISNSIIEGLLEVVIGVFLDQVLERKEFSGFGLFLKVPPGFQEHQAYFESYLLRNTLSQLSNTVQLDQKLLWEPRVLTNLARFTNYLGEAAFEGWFMGGSEALLEFGGIVLDYIQRPDIAKIKSVRLCSQAVAAIRTVFLRVILLRLSELDEDSNPENTISFLHRLIYWQPIILSPENTDFDFLRLICYLLYTKLIIPAPRIRVAAAELWRLILVQKPVETSVMLNRATTLDREYLSTGFVRLTEVDNEFFLSWVDDHRQELDDFFFGSMSSAWEDFVAAENKKAEETARIRVAKRKEKLKQWLVEDLANQDILRRHEVSSDHWTANIYSSEHLKHQRALQDQQDNLSFITSTFTKLERDLRRPCGLLDNGEELKWQLDQTEGRNRMRLRVLPDRSSLQNDFQPKRSRSMRKSSNSLKLDTRLSSLTSAEAVGASPSAAQNGFSGIETLNGTRSRATSRSNDEPQDHEEGFEIVDDFQENEEGYEDKNRKVMRSLQRGDQVQHVYNVSRIVGLEACEGLLILGKDCLYLMDGFFQRSDGEIVDVWQAPKEERDPYLQMISGRETFDRRPAAGSGEHASRNWRWADVISISKRRFLFRDVAIEVFFTDGRSYLLTAISPHSRNEVYGKLLSRASHVSGNSASPHPEDTWRLEALRSVDDIPQSFGSKFANVFNSTTSNPATRKWVRGDISNFHYLMLINTLAGRTFNDLTQYPVFPWVLADYTSKQLDLSNPRTFRDLSKPMGAQNAMRESEFRERYQSFAEMGDHNTPSFHYGTHYSSAMIVTSYLIRLQPFVQSYLLLQGGSFDHPDRLFYSIEKAWTSASRDNMTDVRELTPEFYYLPEFLVNTNKYNFGLRQGSELPIDTVDLPPWANGDPKVFIAKHREALESPYVSKNLHHWIDLVFGFKQRGEAAMEATNVFHHLSYHGAKNLDNIEDPVERLATIGIIHNFGQTPHQVYQRAHPQREEVRHKLKRLDIAAESLTRLPFPLLGKAPCCVGRSPSKHLRTPSESHERVSSLLYSSKQERLLCSAAFRHNIPPNHDKYMEWGFCDGSVRFYSADNQKLLGLFEHLHGGQLSCALFADSRTLITAGTDCTVSVWAVMSSSKSVEIQPKTCLFGHRTTVTALALSKSFSAFLSASTDGQVLLWDLNRLEFVRKLTEGSPVECARINDVTGDIMLCRGQRVALFTLNGQLLLDQSVCESTDDYIFSCAFYEGTGNEWLERDLVFTGHKRGLVNIWNKTIINGEFKLKLVKRLHHVDHGAAAAAQEGMNYAAAPVTCILPLPTVVYTGDEDGRV
ncbi:MAG: hypothetical protein M1835_006031, partial [Candelina submexicana]